MKTKLFKLYLFIGIIIFLLINNDLSAQRYPIINTSRTGQFDYSFTVDTTGCNLQYEAFRWEVYVINEYRLIDSSMKAHLIILFLHMENIMYITVDYSMALGIN